MSNFQGNIDGHIVIAGPHTTTGGTTHFNFGCSSSHDRPARPREPFSTVPFAPDPDFVDRPDVVAWVRDRCARPGARAALVGLGGVGKSQLAIQYAHSVRDAMPQTYVFWVYASTQARFEGAYRGIADRLELPGRDNPQADVLRLVSDWLCDEKNGQWTMILDNVDDVETFFPSQKRKQNEPPESSPVSLAAYLPQSRNGSMLITSRSKHAAARLAGGYSSIKEVLAMDGGQGLQLLRNKLQDRSREDGAAMDLLHTLDYMPLAIAQAAAYINRRARMTTAGYLKEFYANNKKRESLLNWDAGDLRRDESASNSVVTTWQMSFERIRQERPSAAKLLSLMSCFNPQGIPEWILRAHSRSVAGMRDQDEADGAFDEDLDTLQAYSLVTLIAKTDACEMHPLVQFCTRVWLSSFNSAKRWDEVFLGLMAREFPSGEYENWARCQQLLPHIETLFSTEPAADEALKTWSRLLTNVAWYMCKKGNYAIAHEIAAKALTARERVLGREDLQTLESVATLASALRAQGKYKEAETMIRRALAGREKELGAQHPDTLISIISLAMVLEAQGKHKEAETLNRQALAGSEKELGAQHPDTLISMNNLALVLQAQGKYKEARELYQRASDGFELSLGSQHPWTVQCLKNFSAMQQKAGQARIKRSMKSATNGQASNSDLGSLRDRHTSMWSRLKARIKTNGL